MVTQALLDEHTRQFSLGALARLYGVTPKIESELYNYIRSNVPGAQPGRKAMGDFWRLAGDDPRVIEYAAGDTITTYELFMAQLAKMQDQGLDVVFGVENELTKVLVPMERRGIAINRVATETILKEIPQIIGRLRDKLGPVHYNMNTRAKADLIDYFSMHKINDWPITEKGNPSFTTNYYIRTPEGQQVLEVNKYEHFLSAFFIPFITKHIFKPGVVNTSFNQVKGDEYGTISGRLSSSNPNLQQVPKRDKTVGKLFRSLFKARDGYFLAEVDYSQAEPRLYAHYSKEPRLIEGYSATPYIDMHQIASDMLGINRDWAKIINLGMMYGMGKLKLARSLNIEEKEASEILNRYYKGLPRLRQFRDLATRVAEKRGHVLTILGRQRRFPNGKGAYKAGNAVIQGGSAEILKWKMIELARYFSTLPADTIHFLLNIHDSFVFEVQDSELGKQALTEAKRIMEQVNDGPFYLRLPFVANVSTGYTWAEATYGSGSIG